MRASEPLLELRLLQLEDSLDSSHASLQGLILKRLHLPADYHDPAFRWQIERRSLDARGRGEPHFIFQVHVSLKAKDVPKLKNSKDILRLESRQAEEALPNWQGSRPVVVGSGPAGLFAAYELALAGARPLIIERGAPVEERARAVALYWQGGSLDPENNVQFGEGGAGTFSDGKLTTRIKDSLVGLVVERFQHFGAQDEILYLQKPHIGTDVLQLILKNMRQAIEVLGGEYRFHTRFEGLILEKGSRRVLGIKTNQGDIAAETVFLGLGHSARDSFRALARDGVALAPKPFAVGLRIEHPQTLINRARYGRFAEDSRLPAADYQVAVEGRPGERVYSFCMCPGGLVVASASAPETIVTNGMSYSGRNLANANSALLCPYDPTLSAPGELFAGIHFQEALERRAYELAGRSNLAPAERLDDFLARQPEKQLKEPGQSVQPSYRPGVAMRNLHELLPQPMAESIALALPRMAKFLPDFDLPEAILTGPESRSSSPIRILRETTSRQSENTPGLYPIGEGAGYAGGISSSAVDGIRSARAALGAQQSL